MKKLVTHKTNRRRFLISAGLATAGIISGCDSYNSNAITETHTLRDHAFGTTVSLSVAHSDRAIAKQGLDDAFGQLRLVESLMSLYDPGSQLSQLNHNKVLSNPHPYLVDILRQSNDVSRKSNGAFDVTVQPIWVLWDRTHRDQKTIDPLSLANACRAVDWRRIQITDSQITIAPQTRITLNGIAQGYAADKAANALLTHGIQNALLDTGEISAVGKSIDSTSFQRTSTSNTSQQWQVGIQHPRIDSAYVAIAGLDNRCLATSGDYESGFDEEFQNHHLLDPSTGQSPSELSSVSIVAQSATLADALSTAAFVMGPENGSELIKRTQGADGLFVLKSGRVLKTAGFPLLTAGEAKS